MTSFMEAIYQAYSTFVPKMSITFSPHTPAGVDKILGGMTDRIEQETHSAKGNVIFAVMQIAQASGAVCVELGALHAKISASVAKGDVEDGMVDKQPQVKEQAAVAHAMFLFVDDAWAQRYFDQNDLHFLEREVFG